jgi:hypothetical protein
MNVASIVERWALLPEICQGIFSKLLQAFGIWWENWRPRRDRESLKRGGQQAGRVRLQSSKETDASRQKEKDMQMESEWRGRQGGAANGEGDGETVV